MDDIGIFFFIIFAAVIVKSLLGAVVGEMAKEKGYSLAGFFVLGFCFFIIGLITAICLNDKNKEIKRTSHNITIKPADNHAELMEFKRLLDANIITREEFDAKKKELLEL